MGLGLWVTCLDIVTDAFGIPLRERCLGGDCYLLLLCGCKHKSIYISYVFYQTDMPWYLAKHTFWLWMSLFANIENVIAVLYQLTHKIVNDCHFRTRGIN